MSGRRNGQGSNMAATATATVTWRWITGIAISGLTVVGGLVLTLAIYVVNTTAANLERAQTGLELRVKTLEDRQLPAAERLANIEASVKSVDEKVGTLTSSVDKLTTQIQMDRPRTSSK